MANIYHNFTKTIKWIKLLATIESSISINVEIASIAAEIDFNRIMAIRLRFIDTYPMYVTEEAFAFLGSICIIVTPTPLKPTLTSATWATITFL